MANTDDADALTTMDPIVREARKRFDRCSEFEAVWRQRCIQDIKMANGDSHNGYQWPNEVRNIRERSARPCLTMNLIKPHNRMISNEARKNKSSVRYIGMGNGATEEMAQVYQDIHRWIEYQSGAQAAYTKAREFQIDGGLGWWRILTRYSSPESFDLDICIEPVNDPLMIYMDCDIQRLDGLDANYGFVFDDIDQVEFEDAYPELKGLVGNQPLGMGTVAQNWVPQHKIRLVEYMRKVKVERTLLSFVHRGRRVNIGQDTFEKLVQDEDARNKIIRSPQTKKRDVLDNKVEWYLIAGEQRIDETEWPGRYIPLVRCVGEEIILDGQVDRKGHTRYMLDGQRMFNYNASAQVEFGALQTKAPWLAPAKAIEEYESIWRTLNISTPAVVPFNHYDDEHPDVPLPAPVRVDPPQVSPAFQQGMENARQQIMMVTGQYENAMGEQGNERTGAAINARRNQGATATYHFQDNYELALIATGKMFLDLIPRVMDTRRVLQIMNNDGVSYEVVTDPAAQRAYLEETAHDGKVVRKVLNPLVGRFDVAASVGPAYEVKRDEVVDQLTIVLTQAPNLIPLMGDILVKNMGFDGAQEAAQRLRRMIPPQALGTGPSPDLQAARQQIAALTQALQKLIDKNAKDQLKLAGKDQLRDIEAYNAETKRMQALGDALQLDADGLREIVTRLFEESQQTQVSQIEQENREGEDLTPGGSAVAGAHVGPSPSAPPIPGARQAPDGHWYIEHERGRFARVEPRAAVGRSGGRPNGRGQ